MRASKKLGNKMFKKLKTKKRKGLLLLGIELTPSVMFATIAIASAIALSTIPTQMKNKFEDRFETDMGKLGVMLYGIMDIGGFIESTTAPCSTAQTTVGLSAASLDECQDFNNFYLVDLDGGDDNTDGTKSYYGLLNNYGTAKLYFAENPSDNTQFYLFADMSTVSDKYRDPLVNERAMSYYLKENFPSELKAIDYEATDLSTATGGTTSDSLVRFLFEK